MHPFGNDSTAKTQHWQETRPSTMPCTKMNLCPWPSWLAIPVLAASLAGCSWTSPDSVPALQANQLVNSALMTVPAPPGGSGEPGAWSGNGQTEASSLRILTFGSQAQANAGASEVAAATADEVGWTEVSCDNSTMVLEGEELLDGYTVVVTVSVPLGKRTVTLTATSPGRRAGSAAGSGGTISTVGPVAFSGAGCYDVALGRALATAASG